MVPDTLPPEVATTSLSQSTKTASCPSLALSSAGSAMQADNVAAHLVRPRLAKQVVTWSLSKGFVLANLPFKKVTPTLLDSLVVLPSSLTFESTKAVFTRRLLAAIAAD